jgi:hypothetical protein
MEPILSLYERFGGETSLEQDLVDLARAMPGWVRPLYSFALRWILPWIRGLKLRSTLDSVDRQSDQIAGQWIDADLGVQVVRAARAIQAENPDATVKILITDRDPADPLRLLVGIERPPTPGDAAQELLGFSSIEVRAPWTIKTDQQP